jgi:hypothetical protein
MNAINGVVPQAKPGMSPERRRREENVPGGEQQTNTS